MPLPNHEWAAAAASTADNVSHSRRVFSHSAAPTSAYTRHLQAADAYLRYYGGAVPKLEKARSERDILEENHQFIRADDSDDSGKDEEKLMAKKYYDRLFKEFAVVELGRWKERQIAMRWRTKEEVLKGKGQFLCANLSCGNRESTLDEDPDDAAEGNGTSGGLRGFELMFEYVEQGGKKNALVKVRVCDECTEKLRYIQGSEGKKKERHKSRGKEEGRSRESRRRSRSRGHEERKRRRDNHGSGNHERDRSRTRRRHKERRRSRSPKKDGEGYKSRHRSPLVKAPE